MIGKIKYQEAADAQCARVHDLDQRSHCAEAPGKRQSKSRPGITRMHSRNGTEVDTTGLGTDTFDV